jgi:hypothetical protein
MPYEVFSISHNPNKTDGWFYEKMLDFFWFDKNEVIYFEHNKDAVEKAKETWINTFWYDKDKKDLVELEQFLSDNLLQEQITSSYKNLWEDKESMNLAEM